MSQSDDTNSTLSARIMIVDDDPNCVRGLVLLLGKQGYNDFADYQDPGAALAEIPRVRPDLLLLDWHMENPSGRDFLHRLHRTFAGEQIPPVVVLTGDTLPETRLQALAEGASDFLTKPLDQTEVFLRIRNHLRLRQLHQRVQSENQRLEEMVHARTAKLRQTIAELHEVQQQVIADERMRSLTVMAGGIAHDFNNSLMVIRGYAELYADTVRSEPTRDEMRNAFATITTAADDAGEVVRRLREFYRPFPDRGAGRRRSDLNALIHESLEMASPRWKVQSQANGVTVVAETELQTLPEISVVPSEMREVLLNLIFNALDAMPQGGRITVRTRPTDEEVILEVQDTGTGMTEETARHCLEPFYSTKGKRGSGLGLAIAYGIVKRHGGTIKAQTVLNSGSTFTVSLPIRAEEDAIPDNVLNLPVQQHLRILVVDDDPQIRYILTRYLEEDEHSITTAANAVEALVKFLVNDFDLVLTDRVMPKISGEQLAAAMRAQKPQQPIILLTGFEMSSQPPEVNLLVRKPASMGRIREAISRVMTHERTYSPEPTA